MADETESVVSHYSDENQSIFSESPVPSVDGPLENRVIQPEAYDYSKLVDLSGVPICAMCDRLIEENQPKTELFCKHALHTLCFCTGYWNLDIHKCMRCERPYFSQTDRINNPEIVETLNKKKVSKKNKKLETFEEEVLQNKELLQDLKIVKKSIREASAAANKFRKFGRAKAREFKEETQTLVNMIRDTKKRYKDSIMNSEQMKLWRKKKARALYFYRVFEQKHTPITIEKLGAIKALKIPDRWTIRRSIHIYSWSLNLWLRIRGW
jgi:hypothetical protein